VLKHVSLVAKRYREFADQCFTRARSADAEHDRRRFLETAMDWLEAARRAEAAARATPEHRSPCIDADKGTDTG
jgi:hypothetical protein